MNIKPVLQQMLKGLLEGEEGEGGGGGGRGGGGGGGEQSNNKMALHMYLSVVT